MVMKELNRLKKKLANCKSPILAAMIEAEIYDLEIKLGMREDLAKEGRFEG